MVYLESKLKQESYGWCIFESKSQKTVGQIYMETSKQETNYRWCFEMSKWLPKEKVCVFGHWQEASKLQCMYLAYKKVKNTI